MAKRNIFRVTVGKKLPPLKRQIIVFQNEVRKDMVPVGKSLEKSLERVVFNWSSETKPTFKVKTVVTAQRIGINLTVREANRQKPVWEWVDRTGTKAHIIRPKKKPSLRFRTGYRPKTRPNPARFGGSGKSSGPWRSAKQVKHPGFKPRKFTEQILRDLRPEFNRAIKNGGRRGMRRALGG